MADIDLQQLVQNAETEHQQDKAKDIQNKIRYVLNQIEVFRSKVKKAEQDLEKQRGHLAKAEAKFESLKQGRWEVLQQIDTTKVLGEAQE